MHDTSHRKAATYARLAVAAMFFANGLILGSWAPQIPILLSRLAITETVLGLLILGFGLGALVAMPVCGLLIARFSSRKVLQVFAFACAFGLLIVAAAPNLLLAAPAMLLFGGLIGGMDVAMNSNAVAVEERLGRAIMSSSHGFWSLGGFAGGASGGYLIEQVGYFPHALIITAVALAIVLVAQRHLVTEKAPKVESSAKLAFPRSPALYIIGLLALFAMIPEGAILDWAALYLQQERGSDLATASFAFAAFSATMAVMRFLGDAVRNRFGAVRTMRVSSLIAAIGMLGAGLAPDPLIAIGAFALAGIGMANIIPIAFSAAGNQPGLPPGLGMSVVTTMGYSGILVAPSAIGFIGQRTGFAAVFIGMSALLLAIFLMAGFCRSADRS